MLRINGIGLISQSKEPLQKHKDHATHSYQRIFKISNLGLLTQVKEPTQEHIPHPTYNYNSAMVITSIGLLTQTAIGQRVERTMVTRQNKQVIG